MMDQWTKGLAAKPDPLSFLKSLVRGSTHFTSFSFLHLSMCFLFSYFFHT